MTTQDRQLFRNEDLVLRVTKNINPAVFDISNYEPFIDALCGSRQYQKETIASVLQYFLSDRYSSLRALAQENFYSSDHLKQRFGSFHDMERHLQFPDKVSCSVDLATATGKSYVMYGLARIMLSLGAVDQVLVLCPSLTIERELVRKFKSLTQDLTLKDLLPGTSVYRNPDITDGSQTVTAGSICIENFHAALPHVNSSIRDSLSGKGERTLVLNDEVHHVYNAAGRDLKRWKEFLADPRFNFRFLAGFSGTCYVNDEYFSDVVYRYSLKQAMEDGYAKIIDYVAEDSSDSEYERFQKIYDNHILNKTQLYRKVKPLTILVARDIAGCNRVTRSLTEFVAEIEKDSVERVTAKVLAVTSSPEHAANLKQLATVDSQDSPVEWITSVSMLTEGWDVQNVFQIVPHEERAFNSKLLIAQVLGRGLRIPSPYRGERVAVTVFNHASWSTRIKHLVDEVTENETRIHSHPSEKRPDYNFTLHNIDYSRTQTLHEYQKTGEYEFKNGISLQSQVEALERATTYERATDQQRRTKKTIVHYRMHSVRQVAEHIHGKFKAIDTEEDTNYAAKYTLDWLESTIRASLAKIGEARDQVSEENRQRIQKAFGVIHRKASKTPRYVMTPKAITTINTRERRRDYVGLGALRRAEASVFWDDNSISASQEDNANALSEALEDETLPRFAFQKVDNAYHFRTPLNVAIAHRKPERDFVRELTKPENAKAIDAWIKSVDTDFYSIEYGWRKGEHAKRGFFNPDFFLKVNDRIIVVEVKGIEEVDDPSDENKAKFRAARQHVATLNSLQQDARYSVTFVTPKDFELLFAFIRDKNFSFASELDAILTENQHGLNHQEGR